jgi:hypothetical protein
MIALRATNNLTRSSCDVDSRGFVELILFEFEIEHEVVTFLVV